MKLLVLQMKADFLISCFTDFGHIKDVVGTTRLNRPSLKVTSPESPQQKKQQKQHAKQITGRIEVQNE